MLCVGAGAGDLLMAHSVDRETLCDEGVDGLSAGDRRALECCTPDGRPRADHCRLALEFEISLPPRTFTTCRVTVCDISHYSTLKNVCLSSTLMVMLVSFLTADDCCASTTQTDPPIPCSVTVIIVSTHLM